jgi:Rps23 Pro-64 3,4-dihydroxylase Tpa1-like proline 4-hydroxylase
LQELIAAITSHRQLCNHLGGRGRPVLVAHAYPRGGYLEEHADDAVDAGSRRAVSLVWHASARWEAIWGGHLRFTGRTEETLTPRFGALHIFEPREHNRHEVTMVTGPDVRYTLSGWLYERAS